MDPYELHHQKPGSHQFCQTFSLLYALSQCNADYKRDYFDKLKAGSSPTDYAVFAHNIRVVIAFWRHMFTTYHNPDIVSYMIRQIKAINIGLQKDPDRQGRTKEIAANSKMINLPFILDRIADIDTYAVEIAKRT
jgi:hypothetical protein